MNEMEKSPQYASQKLGTVYTGNLLSGMPYQRPVKDWKVNKLVREWDERLADPVTVSAILRLMEVNGFKWTLDKDIPGAYEIRAARAVLSAYRLLGQDAFDRLLRLLAGAWQGAPCSLKGGFLSGMALFVKTYETELVDRTAIKRLSAIDPEEVIRRGKTDFSTNRAALRYARVLWKKYNCQRGGRKLAYRFKE